jgi:hypothetical protein
LKKFAGGNIHPKTFMRCFWQFMPASLQSMAIFSAICSKTVALIAPRGLLFKQPETAENYRSSIAL